MGELNPDFLANEGLTPASQREVACMTTTVANLSIISGNDAKDLADERPLGSGVTFPSPRFRVGKAIYLMKLCSAQRDGASAKLHHRFCKARGAVGFADHISFFPDAVSGYNISRT